MHEDADRFAFPDLPEEAVVALDQFLEDFYHHFQNHYFAQLHQHYHDPMPLPPLDDPPF